MNLKTTLQNVLFVLCCISNGMYAQISLGYLGDSGIEKDPNVIFTEMFEQTDISTLIANYSTSKVFSNFSFDSSVPIGSAGTQSCKLTTVDGATNTEDTSLFKRLNSGIDDTVFIRYYIKYNTQFTFHHSGVWAGGNNPGVPNPSAPGGYLPKGDEAFHVGSEVRGAAKSAQTSANFGFYNYWMNMRQSTQINPATGTGYYWGNEFNPMTTINMAEWNCIEIMIKLNNPVSESNGELALWINGTKISHFGKDFPSGTWKDQIFTEGNGSPFEGFQWRNDPALVFNYIWLKNYSTNNDTDTNPNDVWFDHLVVAKEYIGPIAIQTLSVQELNDDSSFSIAPNPTTDLIKIQEGNVPLKTIQLFNINGVLIRTYTTNEIATESLAKGVYFILIKTETQTITKKFVKI